MLLRDTPWNVPFWAALGVAILAGSSDIGHAAEPPTGAAILQQLRSFATMDSVLYIAAHPDDENTQVITYLARGRGYRTAYLSLTRGDGGQNLLRPKLGEALGVARTQELLAARRLDGGRQYFTRAKDFGSYKGILSFDETPQAPYPYALHLSVGNDVIPGHLPNPELHWLQSLFFTPGEVPFLLSEPGRRVLAL
jgi:hypothetical protein